MLRTQVIVLVSAILLLGVVLDLVRRRRLREEYSWLWLAAALFYLLMALRPDLINRISIFFGITNAITAFIFFGLLFIVLILIHYSVRLSKLTTQMKDVAQQIAIIDGEQNQANDILANKDEQVSIVKPQQKSEHDIDELQPVDILKSESGKLPQGY